MLNVYQTTVEAERQCIDEEDISNQSNMANLISYKVLLLSNVSVSKPGIDLIKKSVWVLSGLIVCGIGEKFYKYGS